MRGSLRLMWRYPVLWWLPIGITLTSSMVMRYAMLYLHEDPLRIARLAPLGLVAMAAAPALASGYNGLVRMAVMDPPPRLDGFRRNLGTFYWRLTGGFVLASLVSLILLLLVGVDTMATAGDWRASFVLLTTTVLFGEVWLAAVVVDGAGIGAGIIRAGQSLLTRFGDYAWPLGLAVVGGFLLPQLLEPVAVAVPGVGAAAPVISWGSFLSIVAGSVARAVVRVGVIRAYRGQA